MPAAHKGFGLADSTQEVVFDNNGKRMIELRDSSKTADAERLLPNGKAQLHGVAGPVYRV